MLKATELYTLYADQINCLLRNKSTMWAIGFKNGLLSNKGLESKDSFLANFAPDYDIGFNEGVSYAIYKSASHESATKASEVPPTPEVKSAVCITCL